MAIDLEATRTWAKENRAAWDLGRLVEMHEGKPVQVGYTLTLYARVPTEIPPSPCLLYTSDAADDRPRV